MEVRVGLFWNYAVVGHWADGCLILADGEYSATFDQILTVAATVTGGDVWMHPV